MFNYVYRQFGSENPGGIDINLGYYALTECIIKGTTASESLWRWCGLRYEKQNYRRFKDTVILDIDYLQKVFKDRFLTYQYLADITGRSRTAISGMFCCRRTHYPKEFCHSLEEGLNLPKGRLIVKEFDQ